MNLDQVVILIHVLLSIALISLILIQHGKGADAGAAFGSGASGSVFGSRGPASFLSRTTAILATLFFITSLTLGYLTSHRSGPQSVVNQPVTAPSKPKAAPARVSPPAKPAPAAPVAPASDVPQLPPVPGAGKPAGKGN